MCSKQRAAVPLAHQFNLAAGFCQCLPRLDSPPLPSTCAVLGSSHTCWARKEQAEGLEPCFFPFLLASPFPATGAGGVRTGRSSLLWVQLHGPLCLPPVLHLALLGQRSEALPPRCDGLGKQHEAGCIGHRHANAGPAANTELPRFGLNPSRTLHEAGCIDHRHANAGPAANTELPRFGLNPSHSCFAHANHAACERKGVSLHFVAAFSGRNESRPPLHLKKAVPVHRYCITPTTASSWLEANAV